MEFETTAEVQTEKMKSVGIEVLEKEVEKKRKEKEIQGKGRKSEEDAPWLSGIQRLIGL